jgi:hypothetical protein
MDDWGAHSNPSGVFLQMKKSLKKGAESLHKAKK